MRKLDKILKELGLKENDYEINNSSLLVCHPEHKDIEIELEIEKDKINKKELDKLKKFLESKYVIGQYLIREKYFEAVVNFTNKFDYYDDESTTIEPSGHNLSNKCYYEIGEISDEFSIFLNQSIYWDNFSPEYFKSIKIYNLDKLISKDYKDVSYLEKVKDILSEIFFQLASKYDLKIELLNLNDDDEFEPELDEVDTSNINSTIIEEYGYDIDLINYYNRAIHMTDSSFKYLAFFQVLECLFDEVYLEETIQDAKSIINSDWFNSRNSDDILKLIKLIEKFNKEQNDRNKIRLILEKYFKMNLHDDAYFLAYKNISDLLLKLEFIKDEKELKDLQKLGNIIYDIRNEYTHSNRKFPKRNETEVDFTKLLEHINLIKMISQAIIENYKKK